MRPFLPLLSGKQWPCQIKSFGFSSLSHWTSELFISLSPSLSLAASFSISLFESKDTVEVWCYHSDQRDVGCQGDNREALVWKILKIWNKTTEFLSIHVLKWMLWGWKPCITHVELPLIRWWSSYLEVLQPLWWRCSLSAVGWNVPEPRAVAMIYGTSQGNVWLAGKLVFPGIPRVLWCFLSLSGPKA